MLHALADLKTNPTFLKLDRLQSKLDNDDKVMRTANFTRSPFQLLSFLITYAGLDTHKREYVINNLSQDLELSISKEELDSLIEEVDWQMLLKKDSNSALAFQFTVSLANPTEFYKNIQENCPALLDILRSHDCIIKIEQADHVIFTTQVDQTVSWATPFDRENGEDYWKVPIFILNEGLQKTISDMTFNSQQTVAGFSIKKGDSEQFELRIKAPKHTNEYRSEIKDLEVNSGIYKAFIGVNNFYGLPRVDDVIVKLSNTATFSDKGATASQTQVVDYVYESAFFRTVTPTVVTIDAPLNVYYQGIDIMTSLGEGEKGMPSMDSSDNSYYIILPTKEKKIGIYLYPSKFTPFQMHELNFNSCVIQQSQKSDSQLSDMEVQFNEKVELLQQKIKEFSNPSLSHKYQAIEKLHIKLKKAGTAYFSQLQTPESYQNFKLTCEKEIGIARKILDIHTNWKKIMLNILAIVATAGIGYAVAAGIDIAINKKFTFFSTDSSLKIDSIEKSVHQSAPTA